MTHGEDQHDILGGEPALLGNVPVATAQEDQPSATVFGSPAEQRMIREEFKRLVHAQHVAAYLGGVFRTDDVEQALEVGERLRAPGSGVRPRRRSRMERGGVQGGFASRSGVARPIGSYSDRGVRRARSSRARILCGKPAAADRPLIYLITAVVLSGRTKRNSCSSRCAQLGPWNRLSRLCGKSSAATREANRSRTERQKAVR